MYIGSGGRSAPILHSLRHVRKIPSARYAEFFVAPFLLVLNYLVIEDPYFSILFEWATLTYLLYTFNVFRFMRVRISRWTALSISLQLSGIASIILALLQFGWLQFLPKINGVVDSGLILRIWLSQILRDPVVALTALCMLSLLVPAQRFIILPTSYLVDSILQRKHGGSGPAPAGFIARTYMLGSVLVFGLLFSIGEVFPASVSVVYSSVLIISGICALTVNESMVSEDYLVGSFLRILVKPVGLLLSLLFLCAVGYVYLLLQSLSRLYSTYISHYFQIQFLTLALSAYLLIFISIYPLLLLFRLIRTYLSRRHAEATLPFHTTGLLILYASLSWLLAEVPETPVSNLVFLLLLVVLVGWPIALLFSWLWGKGRAPLNFRLLALTLAVFYTLIYLRLAADSGLLSSELLARTILISVSALALALGHYVFLSKTKYAPTKSQLFLFGAVSFLGTLFFASSPPVLWPMLLISWFVFGNTAIDFAPRYRRTHQGTWENICRSKKHPTNSLRKENVESGT